MTAEINNGRATVSVYTDSFNKRVRIDHYTGDRDEVLMIIKQQIPNWVEKLIVKSRTEDLTFFISKGFSCESFIKGYYSGTDMYFVTQYFSASRQQSEKLPTEKRIIQELISEKYQPYEMTLEGIKIASISDADRLALFYSEIFKVYPTPLGDVSHIRKTITEGTIYAFIEIEDKLVSSASAEVNKQFNNAELTDCATLKQAEGKGHMKRLLSYLHQKLTEEGTTCCYSIARAESFSMNKAFAQLGYTYGGIMVNNCIIFSGLEDMNVWYKSQ
ncbi:MAG: putative beta-lysine N-acetyltransferase [Bacteroidia bacterium]|nr:putative beta-lysine N-acetyltransferase [Bacteroidia bacterium]